MARVIEFQGKTIKGGKWITGILGYENILCNQFEAQYHEHVYIITNKDSDSFIKCLIIPETAGQYTNVIGSDKKKIYDHDIVTNERNTGEVYWNYYHNGWRVAAEDKNNQLFDTKLDNSFRVIGHKYDQLIQSNFLKN